MKNLITASTKLFFLLLLTFSLSANAEGGMTENNPSLNPSSVKLCPDGAGMMSLTFVETNLTYEATPGFYPVKMIICFKDAELAEGVKGISGTNEIFEWKYDQSTKCARGTQVKTIHANVAEEIHFMTQLTAEVVPGVTITTGYNANIEPAPSMNGFNKQEDDNANNYIEWKPETNNPRGMADNNPSVTSGAIELDGQGKGTMKFNFTETRNIYPATEGYTPVKVIVCFKDAALENGVASINSSRGTFSWVYDERIKCAQGTQVKNIMPMMTDEITLDVEITSTTNSTKTGYNVNIQPAPRMNGKNKAQDDNTYNFITWTSSSSPTLGMTENNPSVTSGAIELDEQGKGTMKFTFEETNKDYPLSQGAYPVKMIVCFKNAELANGVSSISSNSDLFSWKYDHSIRCIQGTQIKDIQAHTKEEITIGVNLTQEILSGTSPSTGYNINIEPAPSMNGFNNTKDDNAYSFIQWTPSEGPVGMIDNNPSVSTDYVNINTDGKGEMSLTFEETRKNYPAGDGYLPVKMIICLKDAELVDGINSIRTTNSIFSWKYDANIQCMQGIQVKSIEAGIKEQIVLDVKYDESAAGQTSIIGYNVNIEPAPHMNGKNDISDDNASLFIEWTVPTTSAKETTSNKSNQATVRSSELNTVDTQSKEINVNAYPNPFGSTLSLELDREIEQGTLEIYNVSGQKISTENINHSSVIRPEVSQLPAGIYIFRVSYDNEIKNIKLVKASY